MSNTLINLTLDIQRSAQNTRHSRPPCKLLAMLLSSSPIIRCWKNYPKGLGLFWSRSKSTSASSSRWLQRQSQDKYTKEAKVRNYLSRAAFKLLALNDRYKLFRPGYTVVDLGFAPGAWSQVSLEKVQPNGQVIGVDILNHPPPSGVSAIQGNFLSQEVHDRVRKMIQISPQQTSENEGEISSEKYQVDVVLSDMCAPLPQLFGFTSRSINDPYIRMANTSGLAVRDHGKSIDLCDAALMFAIDSLKPGGSFVCKFFTGSEDGELEDRIKKVFKTVKREKPPASRKGSKEMYLIGLNKVQEVTKESIFNY